MCIKALIWYVIRSCVGGDVDRISSLILSLIVGHLATNCLDYVVKALFRLFLRGYRLLDHLVSSRRRHSDNIDRYKAVLMDYRMGVG